MRIRHGIPVALCIAFAAAPARGTDRSLVASDFEPTRGEASTLFSRVDPESSGLVVENPYDDPQMWTRRYREFMGGGMGSGVAAGDFDGDGRVDIYVSTKTRPGRLFRNLGGWKFEDVTEAAGLDEGKSIFGWLKSSVGSDTDVIWRQGAVFADIDNDGRLDLYVCRNNQPNLLYVNQGDGTFEEQGEARGLDVVDGSVVGAFSDYDLDGWLDVLVLTNQVDGTEPNGRPDRLFRNRGDGTFTEVTQSSGINSTSFGHAATWFDYNGDRYPDLYICNDFSGPDSFFHNNGDGTFTDKIHTLAPHTPYSSMGADISDFNNDGHFDLLVSDMATTVREKDRRGLAASRSDVLTTGTTEGIAPQYTRNALLLNTGMGLFQEAACWAGLDATDWTWSVRFEDFDNDGWEDLHVTNGMVREANNSDLLIRMMKALSDMQRIAVMKRSPEHRESNLAFRNVHGNRFEPVTEKWGLADVGVTFGAATADFDNDGDLDLAYLNYEGGLAVYRNNAPGQRSIQVRLRGAASNRFGAGAIVRVESAAIGRQSRRMVVSRGYASGSELVAHFGLGSDEKVDRLVVEWPSGIEQEFTDLASGKAYLVFESQSSKVERAVTPSLFADEAAKHGLLFQDESPLAIPDNEQFHLPFRTDRGGPGLAVADLDGDGKEDLFLGSTTGSPARLLIQRGSGFSEAPIEPLAVEDGPPLALDFDGDGDVDLLRATASAAASSWPAAFQPKLFRNEGKLKFAETNGIPKLAINVGASATADIDADGDLDVFLGARSIPGRYPETPQSALLRNDGGRFVDISSETPSLQTVGLVKSALFRDVDGDGLPDLVVALEWDYVRYFRNLGNGRFADETASTGFESGGRGWWNGLAAADFNGDGTIDFAVGNLGLNTTYHASPAAPATLFYGDFANNGVKLLAEAVYDDGVLYPARGKVDIGTMLPSVLRKFPLNDDFAKANMAEVYGQSALDSALKLEADNFSSGVFLSQPDGRYRFAPLPREAQIGPIIGLIAADLDGDGHADLLATQNTDAGIPRFHGGVGVFLAGKGNGEFLPLSPDRSGVVVPGNGRALVLLDPDGDARPDVFLTRHSGASQLLASRSAADVTWLALDLVGAAENRSAVGAKIEIRYQNGKIVHHELGAGGSWFAQPSSRLYVPTSEADPVASALVRWPSGQETTHPAPDSGSNWTIPLQPAR